MREGVEEGRNEISVCPSFASYSFNTSLESAVRVTAESQDDGFEFFYPRHHHQSTAFPFFDSCLLADDDDDKQQRPSPATTSSSRLSLKKLFLMDPSDDQSAAPAQPALCQKSNSTGSSSSLYTGCKLRDLLLRRCQSEGTDSPLLTKKKHKDKRNQERTSVTSQRRTNKKDQGSPPSSLWMAHQSLYSNNGANGEGERRRRRKSYLPYKQHLFLTIFS